MFYFIDYKHRLQLEYKCCSTGGCHHDENYQSVLGSRATIYLSSLLSYNQIILNIKFH